MKQLLSRGDLLRFFKAWQLYKSMGSWQILKGVLKGLPRSPSLRVSLVAQSGTVMIAQRESKQCAHRRGGDFIFAVKKCHKMCLGWTFLPTLLLFRASRETKAIDPDGEHSDQSDNPVNSEVVINCVAIFYEEGKGGENYRKKSSDVW